MQASHISEFAATAGDQEHGRRISARERILRLLRARGSAGATNLELNSISFRYGARLWELRRRGFVIESRNDGGGRFVFLLRGEPLFENLQTVRKPSNSRKGSSA